MDPVTAAIVAGAAAALKDTVAQAVKDAYGALKSVLLAKYPKVDLKPVEERPTSQPKRDSLGEDLAYVGADRDPEIVRLARTLVEAIQRESPQAVESIGVDLERVTSEFVDIERVSGGTTGVRAHDVETRRGIRIRDVHGGRGPDPNR